MTIQKHRMKARRLLTILLLMLFQYAGIAQDNVRFTGSANQEVSVGDRFRVVYEVNGDGKNFISPSFGSLQILSGPSTSTNSSVQYVNGKMSQSYTKTFTFIVQATQEGTVNIPPAKVRVDAKNYNSNAISIKVLPKSTNNRNNTRNNSGTQQRQQDGVLQKDDVYIKAFVNNRNPYLGEQVIVTYKIYTRVPVSNLTSSKSSSFPGFWSKNLMDDRQQFKQSTKIINGEEYIVADISRYALFPQKSGKLNIEAFELECNVQLRVQQQRKRSHDPFEDFFNDPFFNRNVKNVKATLKSEPISLNVKPLPQANKPEGFSGAVGTFNFSAKTDHDQLNANDALTLSVEISGKGNIELINLGELNFPTDFETYEPKVTSKVNTNSTGVSGRKRFEYLLIPRNPGDFRLKPIVFSYFDPKKEQYISFSSDVFSIHVSKDSNTSSGGVTYSSSAQEDIRFIGQDIHHIKTQEAGLQLANQFFFASNWYYILMWLPVVLLLLIVLLWKQQEKRRSDVGLMKNRKANKIARSRLQKADKFRKTDDDKSFYEEIAQALWGYIADKFSISRADLSMDSVKESLSQRGIEDSVIDNFINTLNNIEFARFAPGDTSGKMENIYNESMNAIMQAEKALK